MIDSHGIKATYIDEHTFDVEGNLTDIFVKGRKIKANCKEDGFKFGEIASSLWLPTSASTRISLDDFEADHLTDKLDLVWYESQPYMEDGRPIVRSDTRPLNSSTIFTMAGDDVDIGDGKEFRWDFSNNDDSYTGSEVPSGYKAKELLVKFNCPVYPKDGTIYFFNAPWGQHIEMHIVCPSGGYYPNPAGVIPASMLGLPGDKKYSQATEDTIFQKYVIKHYMFGDCPMGDELNAEGSAIHAVPIGWYIRGLIITPESDNTSKGYASLELHRCHTTVLPGQTIGGLHA